MENKSNGVAPKQAEMEKGTTVIAILGEWMVLGTGVWEFKPKKGELAKCLMLTSRHQFEELVEMVKGMFKISPTKSVNLSYRCPDVMASEDDCITPPVSITSDHDVTVLEAVCHYVEKVSLCVTSDETAGNSLKLGYTSKDESAMRGKAKTISVDEKVDGEEAFYDSESEGGDWHDIALRDWEVIDDGDHKRKGKDISGAVIREGGECSHNWPCDLDLIDSGDDADSEDDVPGVKVRPCVLQQCANEALSSVLGNLAVTPRDAPPVLDDSVSGGIDGALNDLEYEGDAVFIGRVFRSKEFFKVKLAVHAINEKFHFRTKRSTPTFVELVCISSSCLWRVYASMLDESGNFQIKRANFQHTCTIDDRRYYHRQATTDVIGEMMRERFIGVSKGPRACEIRSLMKQRFDVNISYWKGWRCHEVAMEKAVGSAKGSYALLPAYLAKLGIANPGSIISMEMENKNGASTFKFLFLSFSASMQGWKYMRRVILLDGTHLHGRYGGCMLTASAQDGNFQIFPIAYAIVDSENDKSWEWFFRCLTRVVPDAYDLVFVSDRHSSIYSGLEKVYPLAGHGACVVHLARNIAVRFKGKRLPSLMAMAARKFSVGEFDKVFAEIEAVDKECAEYLQRLGFAHWTRSHFVGMRYNIMTTNIAESLNNVLKEAREFPIISMVEALRTSLMGWFARRREAAVAEKCVVTPKVKEKMEANFFYSTSMNVKPANESEFQVQNRKGEIFIVDLKRKMCSCREFQLLLIPCSHALAVAAEVGLATDKLVGTAYYSKVWCAAYEGTIHPVPTADESYNVAEAIELNPPVTRRPPGRPKKVRILSAGEFKRRSNKGGRLCTRCLRRGHNKASCKLPIRDPALGL